jgi:aquaporin Z
MDGAAQRGSAAVLVRIVIDPAELATTATSTLTGHTWVAAFVLQLLFTFALCYVVLNVATSTRRSRSSVYGIAIGFIVASGALAVAVICGYVSDPADTVWTAVMGVFAWPTLWVYLVSQVIGGAAAGVVFLALNPMLNTLLPKRIQSQRVTTQNGMTNNGCCRWEGSERCERRS